MANVRKFLEALQSRVAPPDRLPPDVELLRGNPPPPNMDSGYFGTAPEAEAALPTPYASRVSLPEPAAEIPTEAPTTAQEAPMAQGGIDPTQLALAGIREQRRANMLAGIADSLSGLVGNLTGARGAGGAAIRQQAATIGPEVQAQTDNARRQAFQQFLREGGIETPDQTGLPQLQGIYGQESSNKRALQALMQQAGMQEAGLTEKRLGREQAAKLAADKNATALEAARIRASRRSGGDGGGGQERYYKGIYFPGYVPKNDEELAQMEKYAEVNTGGNMQTASFDWKDEPGRRQAVRHTQSQLEDDDKLFFDHVRDLGGKMSNLNNAQIIIDKLQPLVEEYRRTGDVVGVGMLRPSGGLLGPLVNRFFEKTGSEEPGRARRNQAAVQAAKNRIIKYITGAQMSEKEVTRINNEMGGNPLNTLQETMDFIEQAMAEYEKAMQTVRHSFTDEERRAYAGEKGLNPKAQYTSKLQDLGLSVHNSRRSRTQGAPQEGSGNEDRVQVIGPNGEKGTMPRSVVGNYPGWRIAE